MSVPGIRILHMFEFSTYGQAVEGKKFWFDDFKITPEQDSKQICTL